MTENTETTGQLLTRDDVARLLQVSERKVDHLIASGELPSFKIGAHRRFTENAVAAYIADRIDQSA